ncbi:MAG: outer membrane protein assembly factor BamE, partial [Caulobacterales bacterium]|nr:outer membrane protein assembly factor BamE [Caulobacterales bacterium]
MRRSRIALALAAAAALAAACTPIVRRHGYVPEKEALDTIEPQTDTKSTVLARFGNPSARAAFNENTWYYITDVRQRLGYLKPDSAARSITAVYFDHSGVVAQVDEYDLEDGRLVNMVSRETPTRGRELTLLEQLLGHVG